MVTLNQLKSETAAIVEKNDYRVGFVSEAIDDVIDAFMDVLEANNGTLRFTAPEPAGKAVVEVGAAGEKSGTGR